MMKKILLWTSLALALSYNVAIFAVPAKIIILRHAEKIKHQGRISRQGVERAQALTQFLAKNQQVTRDSLAAIYASQPSQGSRRALETCEPTAQALNLPINTNYRTGDYTEVAQEIVTNKAYDNKTILMCWTRHYIPHLVRAFVGGKKPMKWDEDEFDKMFVITFDPKTHEATYQELKQNLTTEM